MLIPGGDALLIFFTLLVLLALCVAVAPSVLAPPDLRPRTKSARPL